MTRGGGGMMRGIVVTTEDDGNDNDRWDRRTTRVAVHDDDEIPCT